MKALILVVFSGICWFVGGVLSRGTGPLPYLAPVFTLIGGLLGGFAITAKRN